MINKLDWDSDFFEIEVGELIYENNSNVENSNDFGLLYIKSNQQFNVEINGFVNNFHETKIVFSKNIIQNNLNSTNIISINQIDFNVTEIYDLAYESGKYSRFFLDKNFKKNKFLELYQKWVDNSISGQFANDVLIYQERNQIMGFVTYKTKNNEATIGLIAVSPNHQGKGIGGKLLHFVENELFQKNIKTLLIPTQENNLAACNFYKKQGYQVHEITFIKHYWKK